MSSLKSTPNNGQVGKINSKELNHISLGVTTYSGKELDERRKQDWSESKQIVSRLYLRWRKGE